MVCCFFFFARRTKTIQKKKKEISARKRKLLKFLNNENKLRIWEKKLNKLYPPCQKELPKYVIKIRKKKSKGNKCTQ